MYYTVYTRLTTTPAALPPATVGRVGDATVPESGRGVEEGSAMSPTLPTTLQSRLSGMGRIMVPASSRGRKAHRVGSVSRSPLPARRIGRPPLTAITVSCCGPDFIPFATPGTLTRRPPYRSSCLTTPAGFIPLRRFGLLATLGTAKHTWHPKISMLPAGGTGLVYQLLGHSGNENHGRRPILFLLLEALHPCPQQVARTPKHRSTR